jgi:hypothetical protein
VNNPCPRVSRAFAARVSAHPEPTRSRCLPNSQNYLIVLLVAGMLILVVPRLLNYIVAIYLIIIGLVGLFGSGSLHLT